MLNNIIERQSKLAPLSDTEIEIVKVATKLFLEKGFSKTTHRMIAAETGIALGTITYHYRTKEDLLKLLIEELMDFHMDVIQDAFSKTDDGLFAYAMEIAVQVALCSLDDKARDLYYSAYKHQSTFDYIKAWSAKKNYFLLGDVVSDKNESDFLTIENITSGIELAAFTFHCDRYFTLEDKISLVLESMMKMYDICESKRIETIEKIKKLDCKSIACDMFEKFVNKFDVAEIA